jgi:hypothetical protein
MSVSLKNTKTALATMFLAAGMAACGGKGEEPQPKPPQTSGNKFYTLKVAIISGQGGHPDAQPGSSSAAKLTGITIQTTNDEVFNIKSSSGENKLIIPAGDYTKIRQNEYSSNIDHILLIKNARSPKPDTTFFINTKESIFNSFDNIDSHNRVVKTAANGINVDSYTTKL